MTLGLGLLERPAELVELDPDSVAHVVAPEDGQTAHALVMEARVFGNVLTALCGHKFVPQKDAAKLPVCQECADIMDGIFGAGSHEGVGQ